MTVREALRTAETLLREAAVPDARLDAEYLLAEVLDAPRLLVCLSGDTVLTKAREEAFFALTERRRAREPLQYILGTQPFMGFDLLVTPAVLIPRADTETLCEQALLFAADGACVLDLCTGSGALAVAVKKLSPLCRMTAADISREALDIARKNAALNGADVRFVQGDLWDAVRGERFSVIVSNPPYIPSGDLPYLQEEVRREPVLALDGGKDGLNFYRKIINGAPAHLEAGGALLLEAGDGESEAIARMMETHFKGIRTVNDLSGLPRVVLGTLRENKRTHDGR